MLTTRDITRLLSIHFGVEVVPYAARLVREGYLPRRGDPVDEYDAAHLLLAVAGSSDPSQSIEVLEQLDSAPLGRMAHGLTTPAAIDPIWHSVTDWACYSAVPQTAFDLMIEVLLGSDKSLTLRWAAINVGGRSAVFDVEFGSALYRLTYAAPDHGLHDLAGLTRITHLNGDVVAAVADALHFEGARRMTHPASLELH